MKSCRIAFNLLILILNCAGSWVAVCPAMPPTEKCAKPDSGLSGCQNVRIAFYNTENLYDPHEDSTRLDNEFTTSGSRHWTYSRLRLKLNHLAKTLIAIGTWEPPVIIGFCEIENRYVLNKLVYDSPLKKFNYHILHRESPDLRGIDVALLFRKDKVSVLKNRFLTINFPFDTASKTREILYAKLLLNHQDTLHLFVNHWPSKLGGYAETNAKRKFVASVLRSAVDSILTADHRPNIVIMGDFNDGPDEESLHLVLKAGPENEADNPESLVNLMWDKMNKISMGTHKYHGEWSILDQFIVTASLLDQQNKIHTSPGDAHIFNADFLLEPDESYFGLKPQRTYSGPKYMGGFSDHLPVWIEIKFSEQ